MEIDKDSIIGLQVMITKLLVYEGNTDLAKMQINDMISILNTIANQNHKLIFECTSKILKICSGDEQILLLCAKLLENALKLNPISSEYYSELGYCYSLLNN